jgi:uncharacterized membrane protein (DUF441 family)
MLQSMSKPLSLKSWAGVMTGVTVSLLLSDGSTYFIRESIVLAGIAFSA